MNRLSHECLKKDPQITEQLIEYREIYDSIIFFKLNIKLKMSKYLLSLDTVNGLSPCREHEIFNAIIKNSYIF